MENNVLIIENNHYSNKEIINIIESHPTVKKLSITHTYAESRQLITTNEFNIIVFNIVINDDNVCNLIKFTRQYNQNIKILLINNSSTLDAIYNLYEMGVNMILIRPFTKEIFIAGINSILYSTFDCNKVNNLFNTHNHLCTETQLINILYSLGMTEKTKGFYVLKDAISFAIKDKCWNNKITKELYPILAKKFKTTTNIIEHQIRECIEYVWKRGKLSKINDLLNIKLFSSLEKPSNAEFISLIAEKIY